MLVPRNPLLFWIAAAGLPVAALGGIFAPSFAFCVWALIGFAGLILLDAAMALGRLRMVNLELPPLVRLHKDRLAGLPLRMSHGGEQTLMIRIGMALPPELGSEKEDLFMQLPMGAPQVALEWPCSPTRRGSYRIDEVFLETASRFGFWAVRKRQSVNCEMRVYPDLRRERKAVAALFLRRTSLGQRIIRQAGQGREFEKLREYQPNDSVDDIHWKASAKRGYPVTKVFQVERTQEVYLVVDASRLTGRSPEGTAEAVSAMERFVLGALVLGLAAEQQGDQFGLITFSNQVLSFVRASNGRAHYDLCREQLYALQSQAVSADFESLFAFIRTRLRKRALLIVLTALDDPLVAESFTRSVELISRQHVVRANMLVPSGVHPLFDESVDSLDAVYRHLGGHLQWQQLRDLQKVLRSRGVRLALVESGKLSAELVSQHAAVKARQLV